MKTLRRALDGLALSALLALAWLAAIAAYRDWAVFSSRRALLTAALTGLALFVLIFFTLRLLKPARRGITPREWLVYLLLALLMGALTLTFVPSPIRALRIISHRVSVTALNTPACTPPVLTGFLSDGDFVSYNAFSVQGWERSENLLIAQPGENSWTWRGYTHDVVLTFQGEPNACPVRITQDGRASNHETAAPAGQEAVVRLAFPPPRAVARGTHLGLITSLGSFFLAWILALRWVFRTPPDEAARRVTAWSPRERALLALSAMLALAAFWVATRQFGLAVVGDSASYFSAGRSLAAGQGYIMFDGDVYDWWPPALPVLLAPGFVQKLVPIETYLRLLYAALFALNTTGWLGLMMRAFPARSRFLLSALALAGALSAPLLGSHVYLLSEPGFLLGITWGFVFLLRFLHSQAFNDALGFCLSVALATLFRYVGVTFVFAAALVMFLFAGGGFWRRVLAAAATGLFSSLLMLFWMLRNQALSGSLTGWRTPAWRSFSENLELTLQTVAGWFAPQHVMLGAALLLAPVLLFGGWLIFTRRQRRGLAGLAPQARLVASALLFVLIYCVYLLISLSIVSNAPIGDRLLAPVFYPLLLALLFLIERLPARRVAQTTLTALLIVSLAVPGVRNLVALAQSPTVTHYNRISLFSLRGDQVLAYLQQNPLKTDLQVYSNCPYCLNYFLAYYNVLTYGDARHSFGYMQSETRPFYLVWFNRASVRTSRGGAPQGEGSYTSPLLHPAELSGRAFTLTPLVENADGGVYRVDPPR